MNSANELRNGMAASDRLEAALSARNQMKSTETRQGTTDGGPRHLHILPHRTALRDHTHSGVSIPQ